MLLNKAKVDNKIQNKTNLQRTGQLVKNQLKPSFFSTSVPTINITPYFLRMPLTALIFGTKSGLTYLHSSYQKNTFLISEKELAGVKIKKVFIKMDEFSTQFYGHPEKMVNSAFQRMAQNPIDNKIARSQAAATDLAQTASLKGLGSGLLCTYGKTSSYVEINVLLQQLGVPPFIAGLGAGALSAFFVNPLKNWNILIRTSSENATTKELMNLFPQTLKYAFHGAPLSMGRDGVWAACYNSLLSSLIKNCGPDNIVNDPNSPHQQNALKLTLGFIAGAMSAIITTPASVTLTVAVNENISMINAMKSIRDRNPISPSEKNLENYFSEQLVKGIPKLSSFKTPEELKRHKQQIKNFFKAAHWAGLRMGITGGMFALLMKDETLGFISEPSNL